MKLKGIAIRGRTFFCLPFLLVLLLFAGCGRQEPVPKQEIGVQDLDQVPQDKGLFTIRYRLKWLHQAQFAGVYMASEKGFYRKRGLDVKILPGGVDYPPHESLVQGKSDISNINLISAIQNYHSGPPLVSLAQISQKNSTYLVGKKSSNIRTIFHLNNRKVGLWRDEASDHVRLFFEHMSIKPQIVPIDWSVNLLLNDAIDVMNVMNYNELHRILMAGLDEKELVIFNLSDYDFDLVDDGIYTTRQYYNEHKDECIAFTQATLEGWIYALDHREETLDVVLSYLRESHLPANRSHQAWMLDNMRARVLEDPTKVGFLNPADFDKAQELLLENGWLDKPVDYKEFYPHETADKK